MTAALPSFPPSGDVKRLSFFKRHVYGGRVLRHWVALIGAVAHQVPGRSSLKRDYPGRVSPTWTRRKISPYAHAPRTDEATKQNAEGDRFQVRRRLRRTAPGSALLINRCATLSRPFLSLARSLSASLSVPYQGIVIKFLPERGDRLLRVPITLRKANAKNTFPGTLLLKCQTFVQNNKNRSHATTDI